MTDYRCYHCGRLLFRAEFAGVVQIVCPNRECPRRGATLTFHRELLLDAPKP